MSPTRLVVVACLSVTLALSPVPARASDEDLDVTQEADYALADAGLTAEEFLLEANEISAVNPAILLDSEAMLEVPMSVEYDASLLSEYMGTADSTGALASCKTVGVWVIYKNWRGDRLAKFTMYKDFCYNGWRVTSSSVSVDAWIAAWAASWDYHGVIHSAHRYVNNDTAVHYSMRQAKFSACPRNWCLTKLPKVEAWGYSSGYWNFRWRG